MGLHRLGLCALRLAEKRRVAKRIRHLLHLEEVLGLYRCTRVGIGVPCGGSRMRLCQCRASMGRKGLIGRVESDILQMHAPCNARNDRERVELERYLELHLLHLLELLELLELFLLHEGVLAL